DGINLHVGKQGVDLLNDELMRYRVNGGDGLCILRSERRHHGASVAAKRAHGFDVGQNAGTPGRVNARNAQDVGYTVTHDDTCINTALYCNAWRARSRYSHS